MGEKRTKAWTEKELLSFWGKADGERSHPALCHMIDVGCVVQKYLSDIAHKALARRLFAPWNGDASLVLPVISFLAAAHDIGKLSPGFQSKRPDLLRHLEALGLGQAFRDADDDHGRVTGHFVTCYLDKKRLWDGEASTAVADALAAHHGAWKRPTTYPPTGLDAAWSSAAMAGLDLLSGVFGVDWGLGTTPASPLDAAWALLFAGLTSVCDWIGSSEVFDYAPAGLHSLEEYLPQAKRNAARGLELAGFRRVSPSEKQWTFEALFPRLNPNDLQVTAVEAARGLEGPSLVLIEAPMGLGKTEAALAVAEVLSAREGLGGMYYALPTQATSNQMFGRLRQMLERRHGDGDVQVDFHLLHGLSDLNEAYRELRLVAVGQDEESTLIASSWFTARKRGLLAPYGVGTIDQSMLAVLQVRHMFVRLFGLAGKVIVFDEVHAYDAYMSRILDHLLTWLAALGSSVVLLSATLPSSRRAELLGAFGAPGGQARFEYPQVVTAGPGAPQRIFQAEPPRPKLVAFERLASEELQDVGGLARRLLDGVARGGCAVCVCNTVGRAQRLFLRLRGESGPDGPEVLLFHARFPVGRRLRIEGEVLRRFGKDGAERPARSILVATQVVEQSLDLDFDLMLTELAPIDLMLQRAGRLHRHLRAHRPAGLEAPRLVWVDPPRDASGIPALDSSSVVYSRWVLLRTWLALRACDTVSIPSDIPGLIEEVYGPRSVDASAGPALVAAVAEAERRMREEHKKYQRQADTARIGSPSSTDGPFSGCLRVREDDRPDFDPAFQVRTRLGRPSITVVFARSQGGSLVLEDGQEYQADHEPGRREVVRLRESAATIERRSWFDHFLSQPVPKPWRRSAALRDARLAVLDEAGWLRADGVKGALHLSDELGLEYENQTTGYQEEE